MFGQVVNAMSPWQMFIVAIVTAVITSVLASIPAIIIARATAKALLSKVTGQIDGVRHHMNSRLDELIAAEKKVSRGEGLAEGKAGNKE